MWLNSSAAFNSLLETPGTGFEGLFCRDNCQSTKIFPVGVPEATSSESQYSGLKWMVKERGFKVDETESS